MGDSKPFDARKVAFYENAAALVSGVERTRFPERYPGMKWGVVLSEEEVEAIARAVGESTRVKKLVLRKNQITDAGAAALARAVRGSASPVSYTHLRAHET